jgi:O-antigen/teichoic acid export membrane protein
VQSDDRRAYWVDDTITIPLPVFDGRPVLRERRPQLPPAQPADSGSQNWLARVSSALRDPAYRGSYALVANTVGTSVIGAVYWAVVARLYGPEELGRAAALISALMLVATLSQLNLSSTLMRFLPEMGALSARRLINISYLVTSLTALAGGVIFVTVLPRLSSEWSFIGDSGSIAIIFAMSVVVWEIFTLQDAALVGLQRAVAVPIENVIYSLAKLALLVILVRLLGSTDILLSWITPLIFLIPVMNWLIFRVLKDRSPRDLVPRMQIRHLARFASVDYVGVICGQITANALPLLVISVLGPAAAGSFYIASLITSGVAGVGVNFSTGLLVEAAAKPEKLADLTWGALKRCAITMGPATIVLIFGAQFILKVYGGSYTAQTIVLFQLLAVTLLPFCIHTVAYSLDRIAGKPIRATLSQAAIAVLTLGGSWLLFGRLGLNAVGVACLIADVAVALVRLPTVLGALGRRPDAIEQSAAVPQRAAVPAGAGSPAQDRSQGIAQGRNYAGRHRAPGHGSGGPGAAADRARPAHREAVPVPGTAPRRGQPAYGPGGRAQVPVDPRRPDPRQADPRQGRPDPRRADPRQADPGQTRHQAGADYREGTGRADARARTAMVRARGAETGSEPGPAAGAWSPRLATGSPVTA